MSELNIVSSPSVDIKNDSLTYITYRNVRIHPSKLVFEGAFVGRRYKETVTIQNCSKVKVLLRILQPTLCDVQMTSLAHGQYLAPGMRLSRVVKFQYQHDRGMTSGTIPIIIDEHRVDYKISIVVPKEDLQVEPLEVDFGIVDINRISKTLVFTLTNKDPMACNFAVDTRKSELQIIARPMKGRVEANSTMNLEVTVMCSRPGKIDEEIWIRINKPKRLILRCEFIKPQWIARDVAFSTGFILVCFPPTYLGSSTERRVVIQNKSSKGAMFCILGEINLQTYPIFAACLKCNSYNNFSVSPFEGTMQAHEANIFCFKFTPQSTNRPCGRRFCYMKIVSTDFTPLSQQSAFQHQYIMQSLQGSICSDNTLTSSSASEPRCVIDLNELDLSIYNTMPDENILKVCLFGTTEKAQVNIVPDFIDLHEIPIKTEYRIIQITNLSKYLSITISYQKATYIEVKPDRKTLKSQESFDFQVAITPAKFGPQYSKIVFVLQHKPHSEAECFTVGQVEVPLVFKCLSKTKHPTPNFNMGITPMLVNEVGMYTSDVRFNTKVKKPPMAMVDYRPKKDDADLIAFPNDKPAVAQSWENKPKCRTIFAGLPRMAALTKNDSSIDGISKTKPTKEDQSSYYRNFLRTTASKMKKLQNQPNPVKDYDITDKKLLLAKDIQFASYPEKAKPRPVSFLFPLTALQLYSIKIWPKNVSIGMIARSSVFKQEFTIKNDNDFPIRVLILPDSASATTTANNFRFTVDGNLETVKSIKVFSPKLEGMFDVRIDIVVNECFVYELVVTGEVIPKSLIVTTKEIIFKGTKDSEQYLDMYNPFDTTVAYNLDLPEANFDCAPSSGEIRPRKHIISVIEFSPCLSSKLEEVTLEVDGRINHVIKVSTSPEEIQIKFVDKWVTFSHIPLNWPVRRSFAIRNDGDQAIYYRVLNPEPIPGITISPERGMLFEHSTTILNIVAQITACLHFISKVQVAIHDHNIMNFEIAGVVEEPEIDVTPKAITFRKMYAHSIDRTLFWVENLGTVLAKIGFGPLDSKEFTISESPDITENVSEFVLQPNEKKQLCIIFNTIDVANDSLYLPLIVNGIIGPPDKEGFTGAKYQPEVEKYLEHKCCSITKFAKCLPLVKIATNVFGELLNFSSRQFKFEYFPHVLFQNVREESLKIWNGSQESVSFCIRTDTLKAPFSLIRVTGATLQCLEKSISADLPVGGAVTFKIQFLPVCPGLYKTKLPVYVRGYMGGAIYNFIEMEGNFFEPIIEPDAFIVYLEPIPISTKTQKEIYLRTKYHLGACKLSLRAADPALVPTFSDIDSLGNNFLNVTVAVTLTFSWNEPMILETTLTVSCTCGATTEILVKGCCENCTFTNHVFIKVFGLSAMNLGFPTNKSIDASMGKSYEIDSMSMTDVSNIVKLTVHVNVSPYPMFPDSNDENCYLAYMESTLQILEYWVYTQGFHGREFLKIPDGFTVSLPGVFQATNHNKFEFALPYVQLLRNIAGSDAIQYIGADVDISGSSMQKVHWAYAVYRTTKVLLTSLGAFLPNVEPEYLLTYFQYEDYMREIADEGELQYKKLLSEAEFYRYSQQSWIDFLLQTYKVFVLSRISKSVADRIECYKSASCHTSQDDKCLKILAAIEEKYKNVIYNSTENGLLLWLEFCYNTNRFQEVPPLPQKTIKLFDYDLCNGVVLIVITISFCPYIKDIFQDCYYAPESTDEITYNLAKLLEGWASIGSSFQITVKQFENPNIIHMIMLVSYLYEFLPNLLPTETITLTAGINQTSKHTLTITNSNKIAVKYTIKFFQNDDGCFSTDVSEVEVLPEKKVQVQLSYKVVKLKHSRATLFFNGENKGYFHAKSVAFTVVGNPDLTQGYQEFLLKGIMYEIKTKVIELHSPFQVACEYKIMHSKGDLTDIDSLRFVDWSEFCNINAPLVLYIGATTLNTNKEGVGVLKVQYTALGITNLNMYLFLQNPEIGDWAVLLKLVCNKVQQISTSLMVPISQRNLLLKCQCAKTFNLSCPKVAYVSIPTRNELIWSTIENIFFDNLSGADLVFWKEHIKVLPGIAILERILRDHNLITYQLFSYLFTGNPVTFRAKTAEGKGSVRVVPEITFSSSVPDVYAPLPIHIDGSTMPESLKLILISQNKEEYRFYNLNFCLAE